MTIWNTSSNSFFFLFQSSAAEFLYILWYSSSVFCIAWIYGAWNCKTKLYIREQLPGDSLGETQPATGRPAGDTPNNIWHTFLSNTSFLTRSFKPFLLVAFSQILKFGRYFQTHPWNTFETHFSRHFISNFNNKIKRNNIEIFIFSSFFVWLK